MTEDELLYLSAATLYIYYYLEKKKIRRQRRKKRIAARNQSTNVVDDESILHLALQPPEWRTHLRMDEATYRALLKMVTPIIQRKDTNMRQAITPHKRLDATLRYLVTGCSYEELKYETAISAQALGQIIPDTCRAILGVLEEYIKMPNTIEEWMEIAKEFEEKFNFPHCLGVVDGKHIRIVPPPGSGSYYYNYKKFHSVVLMACVNANCEFIWVESGTNGGVSDGQVLKNTDFYEKLEAGFLNIPLPQPLPGHMKLDTPFVFVGDEAFELRPDFMKPFSQEPLDKQGRMFNYRLSRVRSVVEKTFGIMADRFKIFHYNINLKLDRVDLVVLTCCILHNFLRKTCSSYNAEVMESDDELDTSDSTTFLSLQHSSNENSTSSAEMVREMFAEYFDGIGQVP